MITTGSFAMIAAKPLRKAKGFGSVLNVRTICFATSAINSSFTSILLRRA